MESVETTIISAPSSKLAMRGHHGGDFLNEFLFSSVYKWPSPPGPAGFDSACIKGLLFSGPSFASRSSFQLDMFSRSFTQAGVDRRVILPDFVIYFASGRSKEEQLAGSFKALLVLDHREPWGQVQARRRARRQLVCC